MNNLETVRGLDHGAVSDKTETPNVPFLSESEREDFSVSDLESDLEPDELVAKYLKIKGRLFEIDPDLVDSKPSKQSKGSKGRKVDRIKQNHSASVRKLLSQIQRLESDVLFDREAAELQWPSQRNRIAQDRAAERLKGRNSNILEHEEHLTARTVTESNPQRDPTNMHTSAPSDEEDSVLLGDMFSAVPDQTMSVAVVKDEVSSQDIQLRDFGKQSGLSPRRLIEEAVRARYVSIVIESFKITSS